MNERQRLIVEMFDEVCDDHPDKSDEWCMAMTTDRFMATYNTRIDSGDVAAAIIAHQKLHAGETARD